MKLCFWICFFFISYTCFGYPVLIFLKSRYFKKSIFKMEIFPCPLVSVIIAARNEDKNIERRIRNLLDQDYPKDRLEIIVVSDGSSDMTNSILDDLSRELNNSMSWLDEMLKILIVTQSQGKPHSLNLGVSASKGEIIVFTDCRQQFSGDAIKQLVANFNDGNVGCVSGELVFVKTPGSSVQEEMGIYWKFEKWLRNLESLGGSVPGATGAIYAIRRKLYLPIPEQVLLDDVLIPMNIILQGYRSVFDGSAIAFDTISKDFSQEKRRKIRTLLGNYQLVSIKPQLLSPFTNSIFFNFISHKIFRLFVPFFSIILFALSYMIDGIIYKIPMFGGIIILFLALINKSIAGIPIAGRLGALSRTFISLNYFALLAFFYLIWPGEKDIW